jgi:hypothetical protein
MFDPKKLEHFLDSLQVETHFPSTMPQKVIEPPRSPLDDKMDKYDIFVQGNYNHSYGTPEFPVYGPKADDNPFWLPGATFATYGNIYSRGLASVYFSKIGAPVVGIDEDFPTPPAPVETPYTRFKAKLARLAESPAAEVPNPAPPPVSSAPDYVHTITAWRGWEVKGGMLEALGTSARWEPRRAPKANCHTGHDHAAPALQCRCGYWSFKTRELLEEALESYAVSVDVIGQVEIWGRVIECENGWRSEYAYPKELWLLDEGLESLSWKYGVPVRRLQ